MNRGFLELLNQLHDGQVGFVIVGGVAAALHGGTRVTFDLDVVPHLTAEGWASAIDLLWALGARPRIPESKERVRDIGQVRQWQEEKGMLALNFRTPDGLVELDFLLSEAHRFAELSSRASAVTVEGRKFLVASIDDLIEMKERAARPQDLLDVAQLKDIQERTSGS